MIVLAGGRGRRARPLVQALLGNRRPRQFCSFAGQSSLLEKTLGWAECLVEPEHVVTVIGPHQERHLEAAGIGVPGTILREPRWRGTMPALLLALRQVLTEDPAAVVHVLPADHVVSPEGLYVQYLGRSGDEAAALDTVVLLAAVPDRPDRDRTWCHPDLEPIGADRLAPRPIVSLRSDVAGREAASCYRSGMLWRTGVISGAADRIWRLVERRLPSLAAAFGELGDGAGPDEPVDRDRDRLRALYEAIPSRELSTDVLPHVGEEMLLLPMEGIQWRDCDRPAEIVDSLGLTDRLAPESPHAWRGRATAPEMQGPDRVVVS